jgi:hypothetical protein
VADLLDPATVGVGPQLLGIVAPDADLDLGPAAASPCLDGHERGRIGDPHPHFGLTLLVDVPLPNRDA